MSDLAAMVNTEREALLGVLNELADDEWGTMTVCDPWTVRHLVAHMTALGNQTRSNFLRGLVTSGFSFSKFVDKDLVKYNQGSNADVLAGFAETVANPRTPPGPKYVALGEIMCHGEDIRRATGRGPGERPEEHLATLAGMYRTTGAPLNGKKRTKGLRLRATDIDWTAGEGPEVAGPAMDLVLGMTGRTGALDSCEGDGLSTLLARA